MKNMDQIDYSELALLLRGAEKALLSGTLNEWQHANTSTFHVLANAIVDLNERLNKVDAAKFPTDQSLILSTEKYGGN